MTKLILSNSVVGTHTGTVTKNTSEAITQKYLLCKLSSNGTVAIAGDSDTPIGVITDEADAGGIVNVALLGGSDTLKIIAGSQITAGSKIYAGAAGKAASTGTEMIGIALTGASAAGVEIEFVSCLPVSCLPEE